MIPRRVTVPASVSANGHTGAGRATLPHSARIRVTQIASSRYCHLGITDDALENNHHHANTSMRTSQITTSQISDFLRRKTVNGHFIDKLKIRFRQYICPFADLLNESRRFRSILDIGCGSGQFVLLLAEFTPVKKVAGIEVSGELVKNANALLAPYQNIIEYSFHVFDGTNIPDLSGYDGIFLIDVLHHIPRGKQIPFLRTLHAAMPAGTELVLKDIDAESMLHYINKLHDLVFSFEVGSECKFGTLKSDLINIGFSVISESKKRIGPYPHFTFILEKDSG